MVFHTRIEVVATLKGKVKAWCQMRYPAIQKKMFRA